MGRNAVGCLKKSFECIVSKIPLGVPEECVSVFSEPIPNFSDRVKDIGAHNVKDIGAHKRYSGRRNQLAMRDSATDWWRFDFTARR